MEDGQTISIRTEKGEYPAKVIKKDHINDLALLRVDAAGTDFPSLPIAPSKDASMGDSVFTIGFPRPDVQGEEPKYTDGKISSLTGIFDNHASFQITVPVQPGNSGGALVDTKGNVLGVIVSSLSALRTLKNTGTLPQNVNYAIKSSFLLAFLESIPEVSQGMASPNANEPKEPKSIVKTATQATALILIRRKTTTGS